MFPPEPGRPVRVMLCDDAMSFPLLVSAWLGAAPDVELVATTANATELLDTVADVAPDVVLLDLVLPEGQASPERVQRIRELVPAARVVVISSLPLPQLAEEARRIGADGYCPKATTAPELRAALTAA